MNCKNQTVFIGDNREVMMGLNSGCIDLIATDPPFNKEKRFDHSFGSPKGYKPGFDDKWDGWLMTPQRAEELTLLEKCHPKIKRLCDAALEMHSAGMQGYLVMMATRLIECHRLLKETGSIYLHCDHSANAYLPLLMDGIFGEKNFRNQIVWQRSWRSDGKKFGNVADHILLYSKSENYTWNDLLVPQAKIDTRHDLTGPGISLGKSGEPWRGYNPGDIGRCWSVPLTGRFAEWLEKNLIPGYRQIASIHDRLDALDKAGLIHWSRNKTPSIIHPAESKLGAKINCIWTDVPFTRGKERSGWRTQKPLALYSRMILASSNPGDVVLDPFCGCATTLVAAENAGRQWIGIDRAEEAEEQVRIQLGKLNENSYDFWRDRVIIRKCDNKHKEWPVRNDLGEFQHYKKHFDRLYTEQAGICAGCDKHYDPNVMHVDHDFPRAKGGQDNIENLQVLCSGCNSRKGTGTTAQLREKNRRLGLLKE